MPGFEDLEVWKRSARLSADIYKTLANLKDFGFKDQITRSGLSIPSNIAEGAERESSKEFINFLSYAKGLLENFGLKFTRWNKDLKSR